MEEFEGIAGFFGTLFLDNGEDLVLEVAFRQTIQALAGHGQYGLFSAL